eukprot:1041689-Pyramimonas_sp.AAC.1
MAGSSTETRTHRFGPMSIRHRSRPWPDSASAVAWARDLRADAPAVIRNSAMLFFALRQRFRQDIHAAGVEAAFMRGDERRDPQLFTVGAPWGPSRLRPEAVDQDPERGSSGWLPRRDSGGPIC